VKAIALGLVLALSAAAGPASLDPALIAGRYGYHFPNGDVDGNTGWSDDVLEIVKLDRSRFYVRVETHFFNGHSCSIAGVAHAEARALVYRDPQRPDESRQCVLRITGTRSKILIRDNEGGCQMYCGSRGGFASTEFPRKSRRPITYMPLVRRSAEYRDALARDQERK
jgi:hypothetical protein